MSVSVTVSDLDVDILGEGECDGENRWSSGKKGRERR